jgi:hypothetical protein
LYKVNRHIYSCVPGLVSIADILEILVHKYDVTDLWLGTLTEQRKVS